LLIRFLNILGFEDIMTGEEKSWYDRYWKLLLLASSLLTLVALIYIIFFYVKTGDIMHKDVTLTGGATITVYSDININRIKQILPRDAVVRQLSDIQTGKQLAFSVETKENTETIVPVLEKFLGYNLTEQNSSIEFTGPTLSGSFYNELRRALVVAFLLMAVVVFFLFRTFIPSIAVVQAGFTDIIVPLAFVDLIGFKVSTAGIAAFLMLIGYSVDTDILLTNRVLRKEDAPLNSRINSALKTGLTMTITSLVAVLFGYLIVRNISSVLAEIFMILSVGLVTDMIST
jgi:preprotein translocase subunit SecF